MRGLAGCSNGGIAGAIQSQSWLVPRHGGADGRGDLVQVCALAVFGHLLLNFKGKRQCRASVLQSHLGSCALAYGLEKAADLGAERFFAC